MSSTEAAAWAAAVIITLEADGRDERATALELVVEAETATGRRPNLAIREA